MPSDSLPPPSLAGQLLIAMPNLADPNFWHSVVLLGLHSSDEGAFGVIVNRPLDVSLEDVLEELGQSGTDGILPEVLSGGPVSPTHGFVLFENAGEVDESGTLCISRGLALSGSSDTLGTLVRGELKARYYLILGYAGWGPGQLEHELEENSWLVAPLESSILFDVPFDERWAAALRSIGVDPGTLVDLGGGEPS